MDALLFIVPVIREFFSIKELNTLCNVNRECLYWCRSIALPLLFQEIFFTRWDGHGYLCCNYFLYRQILNSSQMVSCPDGWSVWIDQTSQLMHPQRARLCSSWFQWLYPPSYRVGQWKNYLFILNRFISNTLYYEVTILSPLSKDVCISIGFVLQQVHDVLEMEELYLLGWSDRSIGIHSDDGSVFYDGVRQFVLETFQQDDTIGFGIDLDTETYFITKNGKCLRDAIPLPFFMQRLLPSVITDTPIKYNVRYGNKTPFLYSF